MEGEQTEAGVRRAWDACRELPIIQDEQRPRKRVTCFQWFICIIVGLLVFALALISKSSFLVLVTLASNATETVQSDQKPLVFLSIGCAVIGPSVLLFIKSLWKLFFKDSNKPKGKTILWVLCVESVVALGIILLTVVSMPHFDIITNVTLLNSVSVLSAAFQVGAECIARERKRIIAIPIMAVVLIVLGYLLFALGFLLENSNDSQIETQMVVSVTIAILGSVLVSLNWWENYSTLFNIPFLENISKDIAKSRNMVCILSSAVRVLVTAGVVGAYVPLSGQDWSSVTAVQHEERTFILWLLFSQIASSALCHWFVVVACKMHALRSSFAVPMYLASVTVLAVFLGPMIFISGASEDTATHCENLKDIKNFNEIFRGPEWALKLVVDGTHTLCARPGVRTLDTATLAFLFCSTVNWWLGLILSTVYIWFLRIQRIERTQDLFVRRLYEGAFLEQSMLLNTRFEILKMSKSKRTQQKVTVYLCATMWHENYSEMMKIIISMFRLDKYRPKGNLSRDVGFEFHIFFDDAFRDVKDSSGRHVNEYAETLVEVLREVYIIFSEDDRSLFAQRPLLPSQKIITTPYGGRLQYTLPKGNTLMVHFKDKLLIRHKKRWSQIMYLYYLLGWRLNNKYARMFERGVDENSLAEELKKEKDDTYILALDGDTDFQPCAVMLLIDRLKLYSEVGAACGRIHPTGAGPMVWYQKFEYAVGHWMQKTAEHVMGCVLCSPGCFSLFRASALMDDNVMKRYTTKASEAGHYVQYDQGEDRWLCTLLLQQGWRVEYNAASDAYTNAPQDFKEFYNQRRRWGPSTMANTIDLLGSGQVTSKKNSSISMPFILYQIVTMMASILGPSTICLMIAGSFTYIFNMGANLALVVAVVPPAVYLGLCFKLKSDTQIKVAAVMSIIYALFMTATIPAIIGQMVEEQTFVTPAGIFFISMVLMYVTTAALHPQEFSLVVYGLLYFLCIPSGYLLLTIYSIVNMNNVTWGTRESGAGAAKAPVAALQRRALQAKLCNCLCCKAPPVEEPKQEVVVQTTAVTEMQDLDDHRDCQPQESSLEPPGPYPEQNWIAQLQKKAYGFGLAESHLTRDEEDFWRELLKRYLEPLVEDRDQQRKIADDLKDLRNKVTFIYFFSNALWLVATFFLQAIGQAVTITFPKIYINGTIDPVKTYSIDPVGLMFLLSFACLLLVQFVAMLYHRIYTMIHYVSYIDTESKSGQKFLKQQSSKELDEQVPDFQESHLHINGLGKESLCIQNPAAVEGAITLV
ncbi:chitin synthase chs-2-like [Sardina pilchardus]|uniref:chitin synthase chs-2-like n=1 Tax=Sardina pilchardus TaxID=27697 RepID=UPI002E11DC44